MTETAASAPPVRSTAPVHAASATSPADSGADRALARGGLAGLAGSALMLGAFIVVGALGLPNTSDPESLERFPDIETARIVENSLYLGALVLWAVHFLALHRAVGAPGRDRSPAGAGLGLVGLVPLMAGALLHLSTAPLSDIYHDPLTTAARRDAVIVAWQGAQAVLDALLVTGALVAAIGVASLAPALRRDVRFGPVIGWIVAALGLLGSLGGAVSLVMAGSPAVAASILGLTVFHALVGWRAIRSTRFATAP